MWRIVSKNGILGCQIYENEYEAEIAAEVRNRLIDLGWRPVRVA